MFLAMCNNVYQTTTSVQRPFLQGKWVSRHQKGKPFWIIMKQGMMGGSGIIWTICKSFAPHSRQITMPTSPLSLYRLDALPAAQPTASKH